MVIVFGSGGDVLRSRPIILIAAVVVVLAPGCSVDILRARAIGCILQCVLTQCRLHLGRLLDLFAVFSLSGGVSKSAEGWRRLNIHVT